MTTVSSPAAPANPLGASPLRPPRSIRRTSTIDSQWPEGIFGEICFRGRARDLLTTSEGEGIELNGDWFEILSTLGREILTIETSRHNDVVQGLVGARGGGYLRGEIARLLCAEVVIATPLNLLLDDFSGASLVAPWTWSRWIDDWPAPLVAKMTDRGAARRMEGICTGFTPGSSSLSHDGTMNPSHNAVPVPPLQNPNDPFGWHALDEQDGAGMRRARRVDVWVDDLIRVDITFQDTSTSPDGGARIAVHEYRVSATADPTSFELLSLKADPRILPFPECPGATLNLSRMIGTKLDDLRLEVPVRLHGTLGCTHLNDVLRSMADVPALVRRLQQHEGSVGG